MKHIISDKFVTNSFWDFFQQVYSLVISFLIGILAARYLGPGNYGVLGIVSALLSILASLTWMGIDSVFVNEIVLSEEKERMVSASLAGKIIISLMLYIVAIAISKCFFSDLVFKVVVIQGISIIFQSSEVFSLWFQSQLSLKYNAICVVLSQTIMAVYQAYLILTRKNVLWFASIQVILYGVLFFALYFCYRRTNRIYCFRVIDVYAKLWSKGKHYIISSIAVMLYIHIDKIMIGKMLSEFHAGVYTAAVTVSVAWQFIPMVMINTSRPVLFDLYRNNSEEYTFLLKRVLFFVLLVSAGICGLFMLLARPLVVFLYGKGYIEAVSSLKISVWATACSMIGVIRSIWIVANDYIEYDKYFKLFAVSLNILLNWLLIRRMGISGAAVATLVSYFAEAVLANLVFSKTRAFNAILIESIKEYKASCSYAREFIKSHLGK